MGIIGRRFVSDFSFEVSIPLPRMNRPGPRYRNHDRFSPPEPQVPELQPPPPGVKAYRSRQDTVVSGAGVWLEKIIPNNLERR
jgi:hypothetical protein